jgi:hypothetical protein
MAAKITRGYTRDFTPHGNTGKRYLLDDIPAGFWSQVRAQARRDGVSLRGLILTLLRDYLQRGSRPSQIAPVPETPAAGEGVAS